MWLALGSIYATWAFKGVFKYSRWWYLNCLIPIALIGYMDKKFVPYGELENFYKFVYEKRKAEAEFKHEDKEVSSELSKLDKETYLKMKDELLSSNKTLYDVVQDLDEMYLKAAIQSDKH
jgi:hypothetical protein